MSPVTSLAALQTLTIYSNQISALPNLTGLSQLTGLSLDNNQITDMSPVTVLASLQWICMENNKVAVIPDLSGMVNLNTLDLCSNQVTDLSGVAGMANLVNLFLGNEPGLNVINALLTAYGNGSLRNGDVDLMNDPLGDPNAAAVIATLTTDGVEVDL
jgi:internalin A